MMYSMNDINYRHQFKLSVLNILNQIEGGFKKGIKISLKIVVYTFPLYIMIDILNQLGYIQKIGNIFSPFMRFLGLPGEASVVLITGFSLNLYAAVAAAAPLSLTVKQITILGLMIGIAHNLFIETAILSRVGFKGYIIASFRLLVSFTAGGILNLLWH